MCAISLERELVRYVNDIKAVVRRKFPGAQFGEMYRGEGEDAWYLPVYTNVDDMKVLERTMRIMDRAWENNIPILVDPKPLSEYKSRTGAYSQS